MAYCYVLKTSHISRSSILIFYVFAICYFLLGMYHQIHDPTHHIWGGGVYGVQWKAVGQVEMNDMTPIMGWGGVGWAIRKMRRVWN